MYSTIIFDLDDTLTDDNENVKQAFKTLLKYLNETYTDEKFEKFRRIDLKTWKDRAAGNLPTPYDNGNDKDKKAEWLRCYRFINYFDNNISHEEALKMNNIYLDGLKEKVVSREGSLDIIKYLYSKNYKLIIATNGPSIALKTKLERLNIYKYIQTMFSADEVGHMKPNKEFYEGLFKKAGIVNTKDILLIGDELEKDIKGGIENHIDTCWVNYNKKENLSKYIPKYEINKLSELEQIL